MSGVVNQAAGVSGVAGKVGIEVFAIDIRYPLESFQSGWSLAETTNFFMVRRDNLVFMNAMLTYNTTGLSSTASHLICTIGNITLRPKTQQDLYGGVVGYQGETAFSTQIYVNGNIYCRHPFYTTGDDSSFYQNINAFWEITH